MVARAVFCAAVAAAAAIAGRARASVQHAPTRDVLPSGREREWAAASGLLAPPAKGPGGYKNGTAKTLAPLDTSTVGVFFSGSFTDHVVLQREPQIAAVYGYAVGCNGCDVTVTVEGSPAGNADGGIGASTSYTVSAAVTPLPGRNYSHWKAMLKPASAGGSYTLTASMGHGAVSVVRDATFGDVWFCSGQSNMWLVMHFDTSRNISFEAVRKGKYKNIRMWTMPHNNQPDGGWDGYDLFMSPPPPPPPADAFGGFPQGPWVLADVGTYNNETCRDDPGAKGCTAYPQPDDTWFNNTIDSFSATCWHFAEHLTDQMEAHNESVVPLGMIHSSWGGTMVEMWQPNASLNAGVCRNNSGGPYAPWQNRRWDMDSGSLWNGMVMSMINTTIKGALWWQGENNVFQCHDADSNEQEQRGDTGPGGGPLACGSVADKTGYACQMDNLIRTWREAWSAVPGTTPADFPFGVVTLAGGTSEGHSKNMGAFRYAQSGNTGYMFPTVNNTFVAQGFDAADPCLGPNLPCCANKAAGQAYSCVAGEAPYTGQFMGSIHPRVKKIVGMRLAQAARAVVYGDKDAMVTGPVLTGCEVHNGAFTLTFDPDLLKSDAVQVQPSGATAVPLSDELGQPWSPAVLPVLMQLGAESPMEVQINGDITNASKGTWLPVAMSAKCPVVTSDTPLGPWKAVCSLNTTSGERLPGWNTAQFHVPPALQANITAIRYAWGESPCCPSVNRMVAPCPPMSCPIMAYNASLPAVPFWATVKNGTCDWVSTQGPPPA